MPEAVKNVGASVRARLLRISKEKGQNFDLVLTHYAIERLLYRLAQSRHADRFVLKGAMLLMTWFDEPFRGTRDLDLLGYGNPAPDAVLDVFREVLGQEQPDGVVFDAGAARIGRIREENEYGGFRMPGSHLTDLQKPWRRIRARAGLEDVRIHDLRHSYASRALALGESLTMIGKLLGHTQVQTTARYAHLARDSIQNAAARITGSIGESLAPDDARDTHDAI